MREPLYIQVKQNISSKITSNEWALDSQIPTEGELMDLYDVGRETVRKAVAMLVQEGILYRKRGIGTFVRRSTPSLTLEPLMSLSALLRTVGHTESNQILEFTKKKVNEKINSITKIPVGKDIVYIKRKRFADGIAIAVEESYFIWDDDVDNYDFSTSITNFLLGHRGVSLDRLEQVFTKKKPTPEQTEILSIEDNQNVIELQRWTFIENVDHVYFYVNLTILSQIYQLTFF